MRKSAFSVAEMKALWSHRTSVGRSKGKNDRIEKNRGGVTYYLFGNEIAHYDPGSRTVTVRDAGYLSATTKDRLNGLLGKKNLGISQKDGVWFLLKYTPSKGWNHEGKKKWPGHISFRV